MVITNPTARAGCGRDEETLVVNTTESERLDFIDVLFDVAAADGALSFEETEEIRTIAYVLKLTHRQFIDAKLKVPAELRKE